MSQNFYLKCKNEGITDLNSKSNIARMILLAENEGISGTEAELIEKYNADKESFQNADKDRKDKEKQMYIDGIKSRERLHINEVKELANYTGRDKPVSICEKRIWELNNRLNAIERKKQADFQARVSAGVAMYKAGEIKEKDWAIHGGIANGLAGPAAGLATALEIQQQNAQAREHNQKLMKSIAQMQAGNILDLVDDDSEKIEKQIEKIRQEIENIKKRLVEYISPIDLLLKMNPKLLKQEYTETGAMKLTVQIQPVTNLKIYDNVNAVVDGSFKALLIDNDEIVGEVLFSLPFTGVLKKETLEGFCIDIDSKKKYDIVFLPNNLWAIESKETVSMAEGDVKLGDEYKNNIIYYSAKEILKGDIVGIEEYEQAISMLDPISDWDKACKLILKLKSKIEAIREREKAEKDEEERKSRRNKKIVIVATSILSVMIAIFVVINSIIIPGNKYKEAVVLLENEKYEEAMNVFNLLDGYRDSEDKINDCVYNIAINSMLGNDYKKAAEMFKRIEGYKDSSNKLEQCNIYIYGENLWDKIKNIKIGDIYKFGVYEQDNNSSNGKEKIEWIVLDKDESKMLLISKYALDTKPYNIRDISINWETCTLRKWLNEEFLNVAFTEREKYAVQNSFVEGHQNPAHTTDFEQNTQDQVFLLSISEVERYFTSDSARRCISTKYAIANGAMEDSSAQNNCWWWLRTSGEQQNNAAAVLSVGTIYNEGRNVNIEGYAVRPAMWVDVCKID